MATEIWMTPFVLLKTVTGMIKAVENYQEQSFEAQGCARTQGPHQVSNRMVVTVYGAVFVHLDKSMVNQRDLKTVERYYRYSLCEERGISSSGDCASNMWRYFLILWHTIHRDNIPQHINEDHYNAIVSSGQNNNNLLSHGKLIFLKSKSGIPYEILAKITKQKGLTLLISMVSIDESEETSFGSSNMKGDHSLSVIIPTTNPGSGRNQSTCLSLVSSSFRLGCRKFPRFPSDSGEITEHDFDNLNGECWRKGTSFGRMGMTAFPW